MLYYCRKVKYGNDKNNQLNVGKNNAGNCGEKINKFNGEEENKQ